MGFIEALRKQKATEEEARGRQLELRRKAEEENKRREEIAEIAKIAKCTQNLKLALEAERQFEESGLRGLINELLEIRPELRLESRPTDDERAHPENYLDEGKYRCTVILETGVAAYKLSIQIDTTDDGIITFKGETRKTEVPLEISVDKNKWKGNRGVLEDALGKVYNNPKSWFRGTRDDVSYHDPSR